MRCKYDLNNLVYYNDILYKIIGIIILQKRYDLVEVNDKNHFINVHESKIKLEKEYLIEMKIKLLKKYL